MATNYTMAAKRHFHDAHLLDNQNRFANTSHLAGLAAECALKSILFGLGLLTLKGGRPYIPKGGKSERVQTHIDKFWNEFQISMRGRSSSAFASSLLLGRNPFSAWDVSHRYEEDGGISEAQAKAHLKSATNVMEEFQRAESRGQVQ